jgi:ERCC4-type nuclease
MIDVDRRDGSKELMAVLPKGMANLTSLEYGDAAWLGRGNDDVPVSVAVERKTLRDLLNSMTTGRLSGHQLVGLFQQYDYVYLLVEGIWRPNPDNGLLEVRGRGRGGWVPLELGSRRFMSREMDNYLNSLAILLGVVVVHTGTLKHSGQWLANVYRWWTGKPLDKHKSHKGFDRSGEACGRVLGGVAQLHKPSLVSRMAKELSGVGWERANELGKHFDSPWSLLMADEKELRGIKGIGKGLAESIVKELRG